MRYELTYHEWDTTRPFLPNKPRGVLRVNDRRVRNGIWTQPICFSRHLHGARNLVERLFNKIKQCRRVATRYDRLAANDLAFIQLASIKLRQRLNKSTPYFRLPQNRWMRRHASSRSSVLVA
jgi:transposase